jgi:hypothetical protein
MDLAGPVLDPTYLPPPAQAPLDAPPAALGDRAAVFARTPPREKAALLRKTLPCVLALAPEMVAVACRAAGVEPAGPLAGAAWLSGPVALLASIRSFAEALEDIAVSGRPALPAAHLRDRVDGRVVARLTPRSYAEGSLHRDAEAVFVFAEGVEAEDVIAGQAAFYRQADPAGGVAQLGAEGGPLVAGPIRALVALFGEGKIALLSASPERGQLIERALAPLIDAGFLQLVPPCIDEVSPLSASGYPVIVLPAFYALDELSFVARRLASEIAAGAAFDLPAPQRLVLGGHWAQRALFLDHLQRALATLPSGVRILPDLAPEADVPAGALGIVTAGGDDPAEMLEAAVDLCNVRPGPAAEIVAHVIHEEDPDIARALERAAVRLSHSVVGINQWPAVLAFRGEGHPGARMLARVAKAIVRGPLRTRRLPVYFHDNRRAAQLGAKLCAFQAAPSVGALLRGVRG